MQPLSLHCSKRALARIRSQQRPCGGGVAYLSPREPGSLQVYLTDGNKHAPTCRRGYQEGTASKLRLLCAPSVSEEDHVSTTRHITMSASKIRNKKANLRQKLGRTALPQDRAAFQGRHLRHRKHQKAFKRSMERHLFVRHDAPRGRQIVHQYPLKSNGSIGDPLSAAIPRASGGCGVGASWLLLCTRSPDPLRALGEEGYGWESGRNGREKHVPARR
ncbi:hypothetical protein O3P69_004365 [Scylla paramamosain]|uniref:Uncharacterized protein n=1 Tax=Scylla paramamosain TaxID=85552 RepID=A0AAW0UE92_SCYPA